jgi:hypothetical protein
LRVKIRDEDMVKTQVVCLSSVSRPTAPRTAGPLDRADRGGRVLAPRDDRAEELHAGAAGVAYAARVGGFIYGAVTARLFESHAPDPAY